jgi:hypothetical protein
MFEHAAIPSLRDVQTLATDLQVRISELQARIDALAPPSSASLAASVAADVHKCAQAEQEAARWKERTATHLEHDRAFATTEQRWQVAGAQLSHASRQLTDAEPRPNPWLVWLVRRVVDTWHCFRRWPSSSQICTLTMLIGGIYWWWSCRHKVTNRRR